MKKNTLLVLALCICTMTLTAGTVKSAGVKGKWSVGATWVGGVMPGPADLVVIADADTVTIDTTTTIAGLTVGEGLSGTCQFTKTNSVMLTINGNLLVSAGASFRVQTRAAAVPEVMDTLVITGDITNTGTLFDLRSGSAGSTLSVCNIVLSGSGISTITMNGAYTSTLNEFNGFLFDKSGAGKIVLASDVYSATGSTTQPTGDPIWTFRRGIIQTGKYTMIAQSTTTAHVGNGSDSSYINGTLGRGMSNSAGKTNTWPVGDDKGYRPIKVTTTTSGSASGHFVRVEAVLADANSGSSTFANGIDMVSAVRYYKISYNKGATGAPTMSFNRFAPSYGLNDGVASGNSNLRVAISDSSRSIWKSVGPTTDTTSLLSLPRFITSDTSGVIPVVLTSGTGYITVALARVSGTTENTLKPTGTAVREEKGMPTSFLLMQNYPNPFNPSTTITYRLQMKSNVRLKVFDILGKEVATLVNETVEAGEHTVRFNASELSSGIYFYTLHAGNFVGNKKMQLLK